MNSDQQKAYDIGYKAYSTGDIRTGKARVDRTAFTTNYFQSFGGDFSLASSLYDYYVNGYNAAADAVNKAGTSTVVKILLVGAAIGMIFFFRKKK